MQKCFKPHDFVVRFLSESLRQPRTELGLGNDQKAAAGQPTVVIQCLVEEGLPIDLAVQKLREYLLGENPKLGQNDLEIEREQPDRGEKGFEYDEDVIVITREGCHVNSPAEELKEVGL
jgi:hypothetical protein